MKSLILYGSETKLSGSHKPVHYSEGRPIYYVRTEIVSLDFDAALTKAKPLEGETVLNTVPLK